MSAAPPGAAGPAVMADELQRRQAATLAADVAGYSRLMSHDGPGTVAALDAARAVFRQHILAEHGQVVDMAGDAVLATFDSAQSAVRAAKAVQAQRAAALQAVPEERRMRFRIGLHVGEIMQKADGSVYGDGVNIAARLEALSEEGGITVSAAVVQAVQDLIDVHFADQGEQVVKNIPYPVHAFRWVTADQQSPAGAVPHAVQPARHPSLAVLPFSNLSNDPEQAYFADGVAEDLITALSRLRWLTVIARSSSFMHKGRQVDVREIGKALGARYVLEGSVRKNGGRVRISCRLIDASTGNQAWAERYDRDLSEAFDLQDEITHTIAGTIEPALSKAEQERVRRKPLDNLDVWDLFQRGLWHFWQYTREAHVEARRLFTQAVKLDAQFAPAWSYLALSYFSSFINGLDESKDSFKIACEMANRALAIDDKEAMARFVLGRVFTLTGRVTAGLAELQAAVELNPSFAQAHYGLGAALVTLSRPEEAIEACATAERLSPHDGMLTAFQGIRALALSMTGRHDEAAVVARSAARHPTASFWTFGTLASVLGHLGQLDEARIALDRLMGLRPDFSEALFDHFFRSPAVAPGKALPSTHPRTHLFAGLYLAGLLCHEPGSTLAGTTRSPEAAP